MEGIWPGEAVGHAATLCGREGGGGECAVPEGDGGGCGEEGSNDGEDAEGVGGDGEEDEVVEESRCSVSGQRGGADLGTYWRDVRRLDLGESPRPPFGEGGESGVKTRLLTCLGWDARILSPKAPWDTHRDAILQWKVRLERYTGLGKTLVALRIRTAYVVRNGSPFSL